MSKKKAKRTALRRRNRADRSPLIDSRAPDQGRILGALNAARAPLSADELAARLRVGRQARREFDRALSALERAGEIVQNRAGALLVAKRIAVVPGRVEGHPDGHGFLVPDDGNASIFLPPAEMRQLMHRDRAAVRVTGRDHRGRPTGEIVEVLERANRRIVGRLHAEHGVLFLAPEDRRIAHDILV
ncbi:MAG TPA: ribonuclease R, partial [Burkholderiales bacterium]|nr:ribonuclease R [Burkholderiales bacterium]